LKFQAVTEKTAKDARGLLYFATPGRHSCRWRQCHCIGGELCVESVGTLVWHHTGGG